MPQLPKKGSSRALVLPRFSLGGPKKLKSPKILNWLPLFFKHFLGVRIYSHKGVSLWPEIFLAFHKYVFLKNILWEKEGRDILQLGRGLVHGFKKWVKEGENRKVWGQKGGGVNFKESRFISQRGGIS